MLKTQHPARCATTAIAAFLALGSTGLLAQTVAVDPVGPPPETTATVVEPSVPPPVIVVPPTSPQPVITLPAPETTVATPPVATSTAPVPRSSPPAAPVASRTNGASRPAPTMASAAPDPSPADAPAPVDQATIVAAPEPPFVLPEPSAQDRAAPVDEPAASNEASTIALIAGAALVLLLLVGALLLGRRRKSAATIPAPRVIRPVVPVKEVVPEGVSVPVVPPQPVVHHSPAPVAATRQWDIPRTPTGEGPSVRLPREVPATFEERNALINRMVAAAPDKANPFRSPQARRKRARLILQSIGHKFEDRDPRIDLSQYPDVWPELARRKYSRAA